MQLLAIHLCVCVCVCVCVRVRVCRERELTWDGFIGHPLVVNIVIFLLRARFYRLGLLVPKGEGTATLGRRR